MKNLREKVKPNCNRRFEEDFRRQLICDKDESNTVIASSNSIASIFFFFFFFFLCFFCLKMIVTTLVWAGPGYSPRSNDGSHSLNNNLWENYTLILYNTPASSKFHRFNFRTYFVVKKSSTTGHNGLILENCLKFK
jgi:hypothetical protein